MLIKKYAPIFHKGITLGFLAGFIGLLVHALAANTFIIVRIMEPFWFLTAMIVMIPELEKAGGTNADSLPGSGISKRLKGA